MDKLLGNHNIEYISFLKMNIEGTEKLAMKEMKNTLKKTRFTCIACHDFLHKRNGQRNMRTKEIIINSLKKTCSKSSLEILTKETGYEIMSTE